MNILKLKSILFSLIAITTLTVFLSSCQQKEILETTQKDATKQEEVLILPKGYDKNLSEEEIVEYFSNLTTNEYNKLVENNRIVSFLFSIDKLNEIDKELIYGQLFTDIDLSAYLTIGEMQNLEKFSLEYSYTKISEDIISRGWWGRWTYLYTYYNSQCIYPTGDVCCHIQVWRRECHQWGDNYYQHTTIGRCSGGVIAGDGFWC